MYKLNNGDIIKLLPILKKDGTLVPIIEKNSFLIDNKVIYDDDINRNLTNAIHQKKITDTKFKGYKLSKYFISAYINNKIEFIHIGKQIKQKLSEYKFDPRNNSHLSVSIEEVIIGGNLLANYDKSCIVVKDWIKPEIDINNANEWIVFIKANQPFCMEDYFKKYSISNNINIMKDSGLTEILAQIITDNREKKLNKILTISNNIKIMKDSGLTEIVAQIISDNREKKLNKILNNI
jgi:hypothetical protein